MAKTRIIYEASVQVTLETDQILQKSRVVECETSMVIPQEVSNFFTKEGYQSKDGFKAMTEAFIVGLDASIKGAHNAGYWKDSEHLRYIISRLEKHFANAHDIVEMKKS